MKNIGFIIGMDKVNGSSSDYKYRVAIANINGNNLNTATWVFNLKLMTEMDIVNSILKGAEWSNVALDGTKRFKLTGKTGALTRFTDCASSVRPLVIMAQLCDGDRTIGYKVANYEGKVTNIRIKELEAYGERMSRNGVIPVQNAIWVPASEDKKGYFKPYVENQFLKIVVPKSENKYTEVKKVDTDKNSKALKSIEDIFSKEQIAELTLGKRNGVNIKIYANPALSAKQMSIIRLGLEDGVKANLVAFPQFKEDAMQFYMDDLRDNMDITKYLNPQYSLAQISELSLGHASGIDISKFANPKIPAKDMAEIRERLERGIWKNEDVVLDKSWTENN